MKGIGKERNMANNAPNIIFIVGAGFSKLFTDIMQAVLLLKKILDNGMVNSKEIE